MRGLVVCLVLFAACGNVTADGAAAGAAGAGGAAGDSTSASGGRASAAGSGGDGAAGASGAGSAGGRAGAPTGDSGGMIGTGGVVSTGGAGGVPATCIDENSSDVVLQACGNVSAPTCYSHCTLKGASYVGCVTASSSRYVCVLSCGDCP